MNRHNMLIAVAVGLLLHAGMRDSYGQPPRAGSSTRPAVSAAPTPAEVPPDPREATSRPEPAAAPPAAQPAAPTSEPASQPSSQPGEPENPLRTPRGMMTEFLRAVSESDANPERIQDAVRCLDLSELARENPQVAERRAPAIARQLNEIIEALLNIYGKTRWEIPREPTGVRVVFPAKGDIQLVMIQGEDGLWRFSAETIKAIPKFRDIISQKKEAVEKESPKPEEAAGVPAAFRSARATMRTFTDAMAKGDKAAAAKCLDLGDLSPATAQETGEKLADQLQFVMDRIAPMVYQDIPTRPDGEPYTWRISDRGRIELARQDTGERKGQWLFTKATVNSIEPLFKAYQDKPRVGTAKGPTFWNNPRLWLMEQLPPRLKQDVFGVQLWQWLGSAILVVAGYLVYRLALLILYRIAHHATRTGLAELLPARLKISLRPLAILLTLATWWGGLQLLLMPTYVLEYAWPALKFVMTAAAVWASYRMIDLISGAVSALAARTPSRLDEVLLPLARKTAKIVVVALGLVFILKAANVEQGTIEKLFAGLGIGGLAFALAAQESLKNFFGSVTVVLDRPFQVGDWVKIGNVEGTVESVGLRSSRIRTFYDSQAIVPNSDLMTATIDNLGRRRYRRTNCKLSVEYSTSPEQLEAFCEGVRELIRRHPHTRKDEYHVWVAEFAASSIDVLLDCFHEVPDRAAEFQERHRLLLDILRLAARLGVEFAFPTRTVRLAGDAAIEGRAGTAGTAVSEGATALSAVSPAPQCPPGGTAVAAVQTASKKIGEVAGRCGDPIAWGRMVAAQVAREAMRTRDRPPAEGEPSEVD